MMVCPTYIIPCVPFESSVLVHAAGPIQCYVVWMDFNGPDRK
jgi:hypothetical protein